jgi:endo-1,4-beta-mannosidase
MADRFLLGINYWPRRSAMYAWKRFDLGEMREDFSRIKALGLDVVRFFLLWEDFQPEADAMNSETLRKFDIVMDALADDGLLAMPTLYCGHMSGVNWLPAWSLDEATPHGRFRTISAGHSSPYGIGDYFAGQKLLRAQTIFARAVGERVREHPAMYLWDLGNEFSNLREPATPNDAAKWSALLSEHLLETSGFGTTGGMHGEDLERDRHIRPSSIATPWTIATMHGYSVYSAWSRGKLDTDVVPFLCQVQQSCSGKPVLFTEFGNPTCPDGESSIGKMACLTEDQMCDYARGVLDRLHARGALGAFWWCWADYDPELAALPPFDGAPHELTFGIVRDDGSDKPIAQTLAAFARERRAVVAPPPPIVEENAYYAALPQGIFDRYREYCEQNA